MTLCGQAAARQLPQPCFRSDAPEDRAFSRDLLKRTGADRDCAAVDIQIIGRKAHPATGLDGWVRFQNEAVRESPCLPDRLGFPSMQPMLVESQDRPRP